MDQAVTHIGRLAGLDPRSILARYLSNEPSSAIAASFGVTTQALGQHLLKHAPDDWQSCQVARALARKDQAEDDLERIRTKLQDEDTLLDALSLARKREQIMAASACLKAAQWDLERICARIYGNKLEVSVSVDITAALADARQRAGRIIDAPQQVQCNTDSLPNNEAAHEDDPL